MATRIVGATTHTYTWDGEGSLLGVAGTTPGPITYDVDAKGRRVGKRVNGTLERQWMYDGQLRIVAEVVYASPVRYRVYGYVPERHLPVLMLEKVNGAETQYRIYGDHLGSLRAVVRVSDGKAIQTMRHGPWGEVEDDSVASTFSRVPFGFAGGIYDEVTGLVRFGAREYDARTGRWLSKDEARFEGGENFFEYAGGDPVNRVDLDGRTWRKWWAGLRMAMDPSLGYFLWDEPIGEAEEKYRHKDDDGNYIDDGRADAYQHCVASCRAAGAYGENFARGAEELYEGNSADAASRMDRDNNAQGRGLAPLCKSPGDCSSKCADALSSGKLTVLGSDK